MYKDTRDEIRGKSAEDINRDSKDGKVAYFAIHCGMCKYRNLTENDHPCTACFAADRDATNHVPVYFEKCGSYDARQSVIQKINHYHGDYRKILS